MNFPELRQGFLLCRLREEGNFGKSDSSIIVLRIFRWAGSILHYITVHNGKLGYLKKISGPPQVQPQSERAAKLHQLGGVGQRRRRRRFERSWGPGAGREHQEEEEEGREEEEEGKGERGG